MAGGCFFDSPITNSIGNSYLILPLRAASNNLKGSIPNELQLLSKLSFLSLKHNNITGSIPPFLGELTSMNYLDLKYNLLTGSLPSTLADLQLLQVLGLSHNRLEGSLPEWMGNLFSLQTLAIDRNFFIGDIAPVGFLTNLRYLYADNNLLEGRLDAGLLENMIELIELDLSGNFLRSTAIPDYIFSFSPHLKIMDLSENVLSGTFPPNILPNTVLEYFSLRLNQVSGSIPPSIVNLAQLSHLDLEGNPLTGRMPSVLGSMQHMTYLFLGGNKFWTGPIPGEYQALTNLRELSLDSSGLIGSIPSWITKFTSLKLLDLHKNSLTGSLPSGLLNLSNLTFLLLSDNKLSGPLPENVSSVTELAVVTLHSNNFTGSAAPFCMVDHPLNLLTIDCRNVTCPCCNTCCSSSDCYADVTWNLLESSQNSWEEHFIRTDYSFNPHILSPSST